MPEKRDVQLARPSVVADRMTDTSSGFQRFRGGWAALILTMLARSVLGVIGILILVSVLPAAFGWHTSFVATGSMEPKLNVGDVAVSRPIGSVPLQLGQVILERDPDRSGALRLHRLVAITGDGRVVTKGDANPERDSSTVPMSDVLGIGSLRAPFLALPLIWLQLGQFLDLAILLIVGGVIVACSLLYRQDQGDLAPEARPRAPRRDRATRRAHAATPPPAHALARVRGLTAGGASILLVALALIAPGSPASAAGFSATTSNTANKLASASRFGCADRVIGDSPANYYKLGESAGTTAADSSGNAHPGTYSASGVTYGVAGPCPLDGSTGVTLNGGASTGVTTANPVTSPQLFSLEIWFKTTSSAGGLLIGSYTDPTNPNATQDRILYMNTAGKITFAMYSNGGYTVTSPSAYNNGGWHLADVSYTAAGGMFLYIDGAFAASNTSTFTPNIYTGYWRIGFGDLSYWPVAPATGIGFSGNVASAAVYAKALTAAQVGSHYSSTKTNCATAVLTDAPSDFYKFNETGGTVAADSGSAAHPGGYTSGVTYGTTGPCTTDGAQGVTLNGGATTGVTTQVGAASPSAYSLEIWVNTTSTSGGLLMGSFTDPTAGNGDRMLYVLNNGTVDFAMYNNQSTATVGVISPAAINNGAWHLIDATYSTAAGMALYIDGLSVGTYTTAIPANSFLGYARIGYGQLIGWNNQPTSNGIAAGLANAAVYPSALTGTQVAAHYAARQ